MFELTTKERHGTHDRQ